MRPTRTENEVSLFKTDHSENQEGPLVWKWASTQNGSRILVSYLIQNPKTIWLKVNKCRALSSPPAPQAPVRYTCVQDLSEASLGSLLYRGLHSMPIDSTMQGAAEASPYKLLN